LIGRARTGTGKTLSFSLPVIESIMEKNIRRKGKGPLVLVLAPTRELAKQDEQVMVPLAASGNLSTTCIYGGVPYSVQESIIYRGLDILVGTPGRIIDFLEKGTIILREIKYFILDEADEMLNMGFRDAIEKIYTFIPKENNIQTLLYSATIPPWVKEISSKYLKEDYVTIDLIGHDDVQTSVTVKHLAVQTSHRGRLDALSDVVGVYSKGGKTMIFSDTKVGANELALSSSISNLCQVLHGDISQKQREITLKSFRDGVFKILVATDVAARGLDINDVDLIIQCSPPKDYETYIHRSGRTGRAGKSGVSLTFYTKREESIIKMIEKRTGIQFQRVGMPQPKDIYRVSAEGALEDISKVSEDMYKHFLPFAKQCIEDHTGDYERALSSALAVIGGHLKKVKGRSLLSSLEGYTAVLVKSTSQIRTKRYILNIIDSELEGKMDRNEKIYGEVMLTKDGGAIIDMLTKYSDMLIKDNGRDMRVTYSIPNELPELETDEDYQRRINTFVNNQGGGRDDNYSNPQRSYNDYLKNKPNRGGGGGGGRYSQNNNRSWNNDYRSRGRNKR
jgi:ATP-dependent RNA helicase DDX21